MRFAMVDDDAELKDSVQRLHRFIVDAVRTRRGDPFAAPVTVSEIYQELAPYRAVRSALGFEMNADYEHALVRMLSGIDGLTRMDPSQARDKLKRELESPNPDVTLYREYAACDVILNPPGGESDWVREQLQDEEEAEARAVPPTFNAPDWSALAGLSGNHDLDEEDETKDAEEPDATDDPRTHTPSAQAHADTQLEIDTQSKTNDDVEMTRSKPALRAQPTSHTETPAGNAAQCAGCDAVLPSGRKLRFCPFCGADQSMQPCPGCGELLEPEWLFCIACGTPVASGD